LEQLSFLRLLHEVAATLPSAITILSGDVHTSCVQELQAALDGRALLVNIVSSGVRHTPMPSVVASVMQALPCQRDLPLGEERCNIVSRRWQKVWACSPTNTISQAGPQASGVGPDSGSFFSQVPRFHFHMSAHSNRSAAQLR
jgi:hypothetical protein